VDYCPFDIASDPGLFNLVTRRVPTSYGALVARVSPKRQSKTATVYIHGVGSDWTTWTPLIKAEFASQMRTHDQIFIDLPGFGDSQNNLDALNIVDVGTTLVSVTASLGYERVRVVGHSMGGFLTLDMASRHPGQVESIHLVAGPYFSILGTIQHPLRSLAYSPAVTATFGSQYLLSLTGSVGTSALKAAYHLGVFRPLLFPFVSHPFRVRRSVVKALCYQQNPRGLIQTAANGPGYNADAQWAKIECPIWATFGDKDRLVPQKDMARLLRCQPAAKCTTLADSSHMMHVERPFDVLEALELWG
jgi:pimeloyl-ACP methyl ester carboxylesterase